MGIKISELPGVTSATDTMELEVNDGGSSKKSTLSQIKTLILAAVAAVGYAPLASPALTGNPTAPTPAAGDSDTSIATTAFVQGTVSTNATADRLYARRRLHAYTLT